MRRRTVLGLGAGVAVTAGAACWHAAPEGLRALGVERKPRTGPVVPAAPPGDERVERRTSAARGRPVEFYTAVPAGYGDGQGLPVCLVLHGASKSPRDFPALGLGRFLTDAVRRGAAPFVLAGA